MFLFKKAVHKYLHYEYPTAQFTWIIHLKKNTKIITLTVGPVLGHNFFALFLFVLLTIGDNAVLF